MQVRLEVPGVVAYVVKTLYEQCDDGHYGAVRAPAMNVVFSPPPTQYDFNISRYERWLSLRVSLDKEGL